MKNLILFIALVVTVSSCDKTDELNPPEDFKKGTIIYAGEFESDGCGWMIEIDDIYYSPINLSENMQHEEQAVWVSFQILDEKIRCGFPSPMAPQYNKIEIIEIEGK